MLVAVPDDAAAFAAGLAEKRARAKDENLLAAAPDDDATFTAGLAEKPGGVSDETPGESPPRPSKPSGRRGHISIECTFRSSAARAEGGMAARFHIHAQALKE